MIRTGVVIVALWLLIPAPGADAQNPPLKVYVGGAKVDAKKDVDNATKNALKAKRDETRKARESLEKEIKDKHGKKRETWPPDQEKALYALEEAEALARADYEYRKLDPENINASVNDILHRLKSEDAKDAPNVSLTASPADAEITVEVLARRGEKTLPTQVGPDRCYVFFSIAPGPKLAPGAFDAIPRSYRIRREFGWGIYVIAAPTPEVPGFRMESNSVKTSGLTGVFGCHGIAASAAVAGIDKFIADNYAFLSTAKTR
jgi:hypothetical protein